MVICTSALNVMILREEKCLISSQQNIWCWLISWNERTLQTNSWKDRLTICKPIA